MITLPKPKTGRFCSEKRGTGIRIAKRVWHSYLEKSTFFFAVWNGWFRACFREPSYSPVKVPSESNTGSLNLPFYGNSLAFSCRIQLHKYAVHLRARAVQPMNKHFLFFVLLPASLPPAKATLQVITTITHVAHTHTHQSYGMRIADENAMEEKAGFTTSDHKKKMTSDPLHGEVPRRSHLLFASTSLRRKKTDVAFRFSIRFSISESSVQFPLPICARGPTVQSAKMDFVQ